MTPHQERKLDDLITTVGAIHSDVAVLKSREIEEAKWKNTHEGKLEAIEDIVTAYKLERAKIMGAAITAGTILGGIVSFLFWLFGVKQ